MKRILSLLLAATMVLGLAGCQNEPEEAGVPFVGQVELTDIKDDELAILAESPSEIPLLPMPEHLQLYKLLLFQGFHRFPHLRLLPWCWYFQSPPIKPVSFSSPPCQLLFCCWSFHTKVFIQSCNGCFRCCTWSENSVKAHGFKASFHFIKRLFSDNDISANI